MILDPWKSGETPVQILCEPFLDLFSSSFDFCSNSVLLSVGSLHDKCVYQMEAQNPVDIHGIRRSHFGLQYLKS